MAGRVSVGVVVAVALCSISSGARADVRAISRNTLVFVTSTAEGEEWQAYRIVKPREPAVYTVIGPGRVLLDLRGMLVGEDDAESVAVVLDQERAVLTARLPPKLDPVARIVDEPGGRRPSELGVYLVKISGGRHRITVRHSEGGDLLVSARFSPPLEVIDGIAEDVPLVAPRPPAPPVQNVGTIAGDDKELSAEPKSSSEPDWVEPDPEPLEVEEVRPAEPALEREREPPEISAVRPATRALTVEAPYFAFELRGGVLFSRLSLAPAPLFGVDARIAVPGLDARRWSLGASLDLVHSSVDAVARNVSGGAVVGVVEVTQTALIPMVDLRCDLYTVPDRFSAYGGIGAGGLFGTLVTESGRQRTDASLLGVLGALRLGATLGDKGNRPFAELSVLAGSVQSDLTRTAGGVSGDQTSYVGVGIAVGYRVSLTAQIEAQ